MKEWKRDNAIATRVRLRTGLTESPLIIDHRAGRSVSEAESETMEQTVLRMERSLCDALTQGDTAKLARLLSDDVTHARLKWKNCSGSSRRR